MQDKLDILAGLRSTPRIFNAMVQTIPAGNLTVRRGEGFWTIAEHVSHLAEVQPMLLARFRRFVDEEHPQFVPFIPGKVDEKPVAPACMDVAPALLQFAEYREKQLILLENAGDDIWQRTATHPEYDAYSFYLLARHVLMHDYWHMYRIEELWLTRDAYLTRLE